MYSCPNVNKTFHFNVSFLYVEFLEKKMFNSKLSILGHFSEPNHSLHTYL